jgi:catechol 2,3-dioxygenase-like lactoylglutathione lyase family enzyme
MVSTERRRGRKPHRLYLRLFRPPSEDFEPPRAREVSVFLDGLDRVDRLVAHGALTNPPGDLLIFRAVDLAEAKRVIRRDPFGGGRPGEYEVKEWDPRRFGSGVNIEPPPARGSGRMTVLHRITVVVRDQTKATTWYRDVLGLKVRAEDPSTGYVELALGPGTAALSLVEPRADWGEPHYSLARARIGSATGIAFVTDSVRALQLRLEHSGAKITRPASPEPWGESVLGFEDPDGNEFLAIEPVHASRAPPSVRRG